MYILKSYLQDVSHWHRAWNLNSRLKSEVRKNRPCGSLPLLAASAFASRWTQEVNFDGIPWFGFKLEIKSSLPWRSSSRMERFLLKSTKSEELCHEGRYLASATSRRYQRCWACCTDKPSWVMPDSGEFGSRNGNERWWQLVRSSFLSVLGHLEELDPQCTGKTMGLGQYEKVRR